MPIALSHQRQQSGVGLMFIKIFSYLRFMKRFHYMICALLLGACAYVGYSDSHEITKDSFQAVQGIASHDAIATHQAVDLSAEIPVVLVVSHPDLGRPATQHVEVSEELTDVFEMRIRPPPEKVQKSEFKPLKLA